MSASSTGRGNSSGVADPAFLLDSNILIYILDDAESEPVRRIGRLEPGSVVTSSIAVGEAAAVGFARRGVWPSGFDRLLRVIQPLPFDEAAARSYGQLPFKRHSFDRLIAAHALSLHLKLVTNNERDFADVPGLMVENWMRA